MVLTRSTRRKLFEKERKAMKTWSSDNERHQDYTEPQQTSGTAATRAGTRKKERVKASQVSLPLLSTPPEIFAQIISNLSRNSLLALSDTCRGLRYNHMIVRDLFTEPISIADFPLNLFELIYETAVFDSEERYYCGFAEDLRHDSSGLCDDVLSQKGREGTHDPKYVTAATCNTIGRKLNATIGSYVKQLTIPDFLTITDILPYAKHCHNIDFLDLSSLMHPIDHREPESKSGNPDFAHPFQLRWDELLEDDCKGLFTNVRSIKIECLGSSDSFDDDDGWNLQNLADLLSQAENLKCLHIHSPPLYKRGSLLNSPDFAFALADVLATNAPKGLAELRLDGMFHNLRNYHTFLNEVGEALPQLRDISISIDQDLQTVGLDIVDEYQFVEGQFPDSVDLIRETPSTCWEYIRMLKRLSDDPRWTSSLKCLKADQIYEINPRAFFSIKDNQRSEDALPGVELFRWLRQTLQWTPTFNWYDQMHDIKTMEWRHYSLRNMTSEERCEELELCRELFRDLKSVGIPVKLLLSTTPWYDRSEHGETGTFYARTFRCIKRNHAPEEECGLEEFLESGPGQWYLAWNGDLVDELTVNWGNTFLQEPVNYFDDHELIPCNHRATFDRRPHSERAEEEKEKMQPLWTDLAQTFPNLKWLNLHIPADIYFGDETMFCMLPESEWRVDIGKTIVVKDYRRREGIKRRGDVTFLDRKFDRAAEFTYSHRSLPLR